MALSTIWSLIKIINGTKRMHKFLCKQHDIEIFVTEQVANELGCLRQKQHENEKGGLLFTSITEISPQLIIDRMSKPSKKDRASLNSYVINKEEANRTIKREFKNGFHYIGDWHTHYSRHPFPSSDDIKTINSLFKKSVKDKQLSFVAMMIIGTSNDFGEAYIALSDGNEIYPCEYIGKIEK